MALEAAGTGNIPARTEGANGQHDWCDGMIARATQKITELRELLAERDALIVAAAHAPSAALLSLAADLEAEAGWRLTALARGAYLHGARMARQRATDPSLVSPAAPGTSQGVSGPLRDARSDP
jgi:phosphatidylglycerophosphate synthase